MNPINKLQKGDNVLIDYNNGIKKVSTYLDSQDNTYKFKDISGLFLLTEDFIIQQGITITIVED